LRGRPSCQGHRSPCRAPASWGAGSSGGKPGKRPANAGRPSCRFRVGARLSEDENEKMRSMDEKYVAPAPTRWRRGEPVTVAAPGDDSIPCYLTLPPVEDASTRERLGRMLDLVRGGTPWQEALAATHEPGFVRYVTDPR